MKVVLALAFVGAVVVGLASLGASKREEDEQRARAYAAAEQAAKAKAAQEFAALPPKEQAAVSASKRKELAAEFERVMRNMNYAVHVSVDGKDKTHLRIDYSLCSEEFMLRLDNASGKGLWQNLHNQGFTRIDCKDGYGGGYFYDWEPKSKKR